MKVGDLLEPRAGWEEVARVMRERVEDGLVDDPVLSNFDETEWVWETSN